MIFSNRPDNSNNDSGFTLAELMVVVVLLSILGVTILQVVAQIQASTQSTEDLQKGLEDSTRAFSVMRAQLRARGKSALPPFQNNPASPQITNNPVTSLQKSLMVHNLSAGAGSKSVLLRFLTQSSNLASPGQRSLYGEVEARFFVDSSLPDSPLVLELWDANLNSRNTTGGGVASGPGGPIRRMVLINNIEQFSIRSRINQKWDTNWENPYAPEPKLLEVTLIRRVSQDTPREVFRGIIPLGIPS